MEKIKLCLAIWITLFLSVSASAKLNKRWDINPVVWSKEKNYQGGEIVSKGDFDGNTLYWRNYWWADSTNVPGIEPDSGDQSPWALLNTISVGVGKEYEWVGWNDDAEKWNLDFFENTWAWIDNPIGTWGKQIESAEVGAYLPTFRDGAEGLYSIIHEDMGSMGFESHIKPALDILEKHPGIKVGWAVISKVMDNEEWGEARKMVMDGHEILNHSYDHTSYKDHWQWYYHGDILSGEDYAIPRELRNLTVDSSSGFQWDELDVEILYVNYANGDINSPETLFTTVTYEVYDYKYIVDSTFNSDWGEWEYKYLSTGKIRASNMGWSDASASNVKMLKLFCYPGWSTDDYNANIKVANNLINQNVYDQVSSPYFSEDKKCEYYVYPFNVYDEEAYGILSEYGLIASVGGYKNGQTIYGDFFHPYRLDYDNFFQLNSKGDIVFPDNPHQHVSVKDLVDNAWKSKGYTIRKLTSVEEEDLWGDSKKVYWWGCMFDYLYKEHLEYIDSLIDENKITVMTPTEAVKYRLTANSVSDVFLADNGSNAKVITVASGCNPAYQDEISVIVKLSQSHSSVIVTYSDGTKPRYSPRMMDKEGKAWSISVNPYEQGGIINLRFDEIPISSDYLNTNLDNEVIKRINRNNLSLKVPYGKYNFKLYNLKGEVLINRDIESKGKIQNINFDRLIASGNYIAKINGKGCSIKRKIVIR